jgi:hypothetical protein
LSEGDTGLQQQQKRQERGAAVGGQEDLHGLAFQHSVWYNGE